MIRVIQIYLLACLLAGCSEVKNLFKEESPHEKYRQKLIDNGLANTELGKLWIEKAEEVLRDSVLIEIPYHEAGYFPSSEVNAYSYRFFANRGEQIIITLEITSNDSLLVFIDLFKAGNEIKYLVSGETSFIRYAVEENGEYLLRLQSELLVSCNFELTITRSPSLAFPVPGIDANSILSFWRDPRDAGKREHQGVDIFSERGTPVTAASDGIILRTGTNRLGGKVVWLYTTGNQNLYYAHLDSQLVAPGQIVKTGDTLGLMGNTGNAVTTPPHLHFGIYIPGEGAVDPYPFINNIISIPPAVNTNKNYIGKWGKVNSGKAELSGGNRIKLENDTPFRIIAAGYNVYRITLPDGSKGFIGSQFVKDIEAGKEGITLKAGTKIYETPDTTAVVISRLNKENRFDVFGNYNGFYVLKLNDRYGWIKIYDEMF